MNKIKLHNKYTLYADARVHACRYTLILRNYYNQQQNTVVMIMGEKGDLKSGKYKKKDNVSKNNNDNTRWGEERGGARCHKRCTV